MRTAPFESTYTGKAFYPTDPRPCDYDIRDIAHALSHLCRFNGHVREFYSVAQHCVHVSERVSPANALWGLCHDMSEAFLGDCVSPLKASLPEYKTIEEKVMVMGCVAFGLPLDEPAEVKAVDRRMCATECRDLLGADWYINYAECYPGKIVPWSSKYAEFRFLNRYTELARKENNRVAMV